MTTKIGGWIAFAYLGPTEGIRILAGPVDRREDAIALGGRALIEGHYIGVKWYVSQGTTDPAKAEQVG